ncbi:hypothetical protein DF034_30980 [Burkholderia anthina]|nr:hypothetical protein DF034_30980 [Burkholderia anthina]
MDRISASTMNEHPLGGLGFIGFAEEVRAQEAAARRGANRFRCRPISPARSPSPRVSPAIPA